MNTNYQELVLIFKNTAVQTALILQPYAYGDVNLIACLSRAARINVTAGTAFSTAEANVGEVLSKPNM